jgi:hypothetical protein
MTALRPISAAIALLITSNAAAQDGGITIPAGQSIAFETVSEITTKKAANGDLVPLVTRDDVVIAGRVAIRKGSQAQGQLSDVRAKGAMGQSGKLSLRPLYMKVGDVTIRLEGSGGARQNAAAGAVIGMLTLTPGFTGRSAVIKAGTPIEGVVMRNVTIAAAQ